MSSSYAPSHELIDILKLNGFRDVTEGVYPEFFALRKKTDKIDSLKHQFTLSPKFKYRKYIAFDYINIKIGDYSQGIIEIAFELDEQYLKNIITYFSLNGSLKKRFSINRVNPLSKIHLEIDSFRDYSLRGTADFQKIVKVYDSVKVLGF